jgi:Uma2 family endonuclease
VGGHLDGTGGGNVTAVSMIVQLPAAMVPDVGRLIDERRRLGLDLFDEWHEGVYVIVAGPSPEHGDIALELGAILKPIARARGLRIATPTNIGTDEDDSRVPDLTVYRPDAPRTSPAFLATAELAVEVLSPRERPQAKLGFYAARGVKEYVEVDPDARTVRLWRNVDGSWHESVRSDVLGVDLADVEPAITWP